MKERSIFFNSFWGVFSQLIRGGLALALIPFIISRIGLENYGLFSTLLLLTFYQGMLALLDLGYPAYVLNQIARQSGDALLDSDKKRLSSLMTYMSVISLLTFLVGWVGSSILLDLLHIDAARIETYRLPLLLILLSNFFAAPTAVCGLIWVAKHRNAQFKQIDTLGYLLFVLLSFVLLAMKADFNNLVMAFLISQVVMFVIVLYRTRKSFQYLPGFGRLTFAQLRGEWSEWSPFFFSRVNGTAQRQSDVTLVSLILGPTAVAIYDISVKVPALMKSLLGRVSEVIIPVASLKRAPEHKIYIRDLSESLCNILMAYIIVFLIAFGLFSRSLVTYWLGSSYENLALPLFLAGFIVLIAPYGSVLGAVLVARGERNRDMSLWPTIISVISIVASLPATWYWGVTATILTTVFQFFFVGLFYIVWARRDFSFRLMSGLKSWLVSLGIAGILHFAAYHYVNEAPDAKSFFFRLGALEVMCLALVSLALRKEVKATIAKMRVKASKV